MRHILFSLLLITLTAAPLMTQDDDPLAHRQQIRLHGSVNDAATDSLSIVVVRLMLPSADPTVLAQYTVSAPGFDLVIDADEPLYLVIQGGEHQLDPVFVEPGADLHLTAAGEVWVERAEFTGSGAENASYVVRSQPHLKWREARYEAPRRLGLSETDTDLGAYFDWVDSLRVDQDAALAQATISPTFLRVQQAENLAMTIMLKRDALRFVRSPSVAESLRADLLREIRTAEGGDTLAYAIRYTNLLGNLLDEAYRMTVGKSGGVPSASGYYYFRKSASSEPGLSQVLLTEALQSLLRTRNYDYEMARLVEDFARSAIDIRYRDYVRALAERRETLSPGRPAPPLGVQTVEGDTLSLSDLQGRLVLATVWGSWCGISTAELLWLEQVRERLEAEDVVFLNLAYDQEEAWREAVASQAVGGIHALTNEAMRQAYGIVMTPTFFLIGRDGTIVTNKLPRPSERGGQALEEAIRQAL